ncbi:MAG TPA: GDSL-type esterase/lipase family protein [Patescibacteria group bacterium]|nr:GDSL-type esterase/lipase family protein [Patescibacteria group bacterium]
MNLKLKLKNSKIKIFLLVLIFQLFFTGKVLGAPITGLGILGDSNTDEYRADDNRGGSYSATTYNWLELLVKYRGVNAGAWGCRSEPRRCGYAYNWARTAANASSMITSGQHTGLASQVQQGLVTHAVIWIGTNDFSPNPAVATYDPIYNGTMTDAQIQSKINGILANITTAVDTILNTKNIPIIIANIGDPGQFLLIQSLYPNATGRQRATQAINTVNQGIATIASQRNLALFDFNKWASTQLAGTSFTIAGETISLTSFNNEPHNAVMSDSHMGTVLNGMLSNKLFMEPMNSKYAQTFTLFSDTEILTNAGISVNPSPTPTVRPPSPTPTSGVINTPTPTPTIIPTATPTATSKPGDANGDGKVNGADYLIWFANYKKSTSQGPSAGDFNRDTIVNGADYIVWFSNYNK